MAYRAMYIWSDGTEPTPLLRSKTNVLKDGEEPGIWGFDGSSTNQAPGGDSDVVLRPVKSVPDPIRGGDDILVLSECLTPDFEPHPTNTRAACVAAYEKYADFNPIFGLEQEYTFITMMDPTASQYYGPHRGSRSAGTRPRRARTTAPWAPTAPSGGPWWMRTARPASMPACRSRAPTPR